MLPPVIEEKRLRAALSFIVAGTRTDGIHVSPILLCLRMHSRIAIYFACRCLKNLRLHALREPKHIYGTVNACFCRLNRIELIVKGRSWTCQIKYLINLYV